VRAAAGPPDRSGRPGQRCRRPPTPGRPRFPHGTAVPALVAASLAVTGIVRGAAPADAPPFPSDPAVALQTKLEKTLFQVDVLTLEIRVGPESEPQLRALAAAGGDRRALADSLTRVVLTAPRAWARMEFLRSTGQGRFLNGIQDNMKKARDAGIMTGKHYQDVSRKLPIWYDFLRHRGVQKGDVILYSIRGDTLETTYRGVGGDTLLDLVQRDPEARGGVLGSFLAPGSDFRDGLVRSLGSDR
jgi:hypothetical protein